jgi:hypothetical protein
VSHQTDKFSASKDFAKQFMLRHAIPTAKMFGEFGAPDEAYAALADLKPIGIPQRHHWQALRRPDLNDRNIGF